MKQVFHFATICLIVVGCRQPDRDDLDAWLHHQSGIIGEVMDHEDLYQPQVIYTEVFRDSLGLPEFRTSSYGEESYFYPASTVKLPVAVFALERCRQLGISPQATMITDSIHPWQSPAATDTSSATGLPSVAHYIKKIFLVSDNDAFNRLYEFVGPAYIHRRMRELGFPDTRIVHRLSVTLTRRQNQILNPIRFLDPEGTTILSLPERIDSLPPPIDPKPLMGIGEMKAGKLVKEPKDFSEKNRFSLSDQHEFLKGVCFFNGVNGRPLEITSSDWEFLLHYMSLLPYESDFPRYDPAQYYDSYVKFLLFGDSHEPMPDHIRIYNKVGVAYGWLIDNAWIVNEETGEEFLISARVFVNENQIFNDDTYEYDEVGFPFFGELGRRLTGIRGQ